MKFRYALGAAAGFCLLATMSAVPATAETGPIKSILAGGNLCLDVPRGDFRQGVLLQLYPCQNSPNQQFTLNRATGALTIGGLCVDAFAPTGSVNAGAKVGLYGCQGSPNQKWSVMACPPGQRCLLYIRPDLILTTVNNSFCFDVPNSNTGIGVGLDVWSCHGAQNQRFQIMGIQQ